MNRDQLAGIYVQLIGRMKEFSDDPVSAAVGRRDRLAGRIQQQRAIAQQETERQLKNFLARNRNWRDLSSS